MAVAVTVPSPTAAVRVAVVSVTRRKHANEVDGESDRAHSEELPRVHFWRVEEALDRLKDDKDRDEAQEDAVGKARQRLDARVAAGPRKCVSALLTGDGEKAARLTQR